MRKRIKVVLIGLVAFVAWCAVTALDRSSSYGVRFEQQFVRNLGGEVGEWVRNDRPLHLYPWWWSARTMWDVRSLRRWVQGVDVVQVAVWPESVEVEVGDAAQFYAGVLYTDSTSDCMPPPPTPGAMFESGTFPGGCDSARAMLDLNLLLDTAYVRFSWDTIRSARYDSLFYHVLLRSYPDTAHYITDLTVYHPASQLEWRNGVPNTSYQVAAYAVAYFNFAGRDTFAGGLVGPWTTFSYPETMPVPVQMGPVRVDTVGVGGL